MGMNIRPWNQAFLQNYQQAMLTPEQVQALIAQQQMQNVNPNLIASSDLEPWEDELLRRKEEEFKRQHPIRGYIRYDADELNPLKFPEAVISEFENMRYHIKNDRKSK